jgi:hypothetical protein
MVSETRSGYPESPAQRLSQLIQIPMPAEPNTVDPNLETLNSRLKIRLPNRIRKHKADYKLRWPASGGSLQESRENV